MIVIDASVAAKWFLPEIGSDEAVKLQEGTAELIGPELIRMEVAGAITRRVRDKDRPLPPAEASPLRGLVPAVRTSNDRPDSGERDSKRCDQVIGRSASSAARLHLPGGGAATEGSAHYRRSCISRPREAVLRQDIHPAGL